MKRFLLIILLLSLTSAANAPAAPIRWGTETYSHYSSVEDLAGLLRDFCSGQGINVIVSEKVEGTVSGRFEGYAPEAFLRHIAAAYGIIWYYDGHALYVYRSDELQTRMMDLEYVSIQRLMEILEKVEIADERFPLKALNDEGIIYVSGPPRYVSLVTETAETLEAKARKTAESRRANVVIRAFPLKYAWANDLTFTFMNEEVTVPGVASVLKNLLSEGGAPGPVNGKQKKRLPATVEKLKGKGLASTAKDEGAGEGRTGDGKAQEETPVAAAPEAFIQADTRLNAVIIRDKEERMPLYREIISLLDVPAGLVQVQATIVDINTNALKELGVDWKVETGRVVAGTDTETTTTNTSLAVKGERRFKTSGGFGADENLTYDSDSLALGTGLSFATIVGDAGKYFLARIRALEEKGNARILSQPSVLTLNNVEALLEHSQTFYVRVAGDQEVDLFDVSAGVVLKVTPHIIEDDGKTRIKLLVNIEDGGFSDTSVDNIPVVSKSTINTQAVINENESLLIGGYYYEVGSESVRMVPCLGGIPALGYLFKEKETTKTRNKRMFLITPKIVTHDSYPRVEYPGEPELSEKTPPQDLSLPEKKDRVSSFSGAEKTEVVISTPTEKTPLPEPASPLPVAEQVRESAKPSPIDENRVVRSVAAPEIQAAPAEKPPIIEETPQKGELPLEEEKARKSERIYAVQVGSFLKIDGAKRKAIELREQGFSPHIYWARDKTDRILHVVLMGLYEDKSEARDTALKYREGGGAPLVMRIDPAFIEERQITLD